jgi:hypothetical protein
LYTGGGGGGGFAGGGGGGGGVVIVQYPVGFNAATTSGSNVLYTVIGGKRIYKFSASGTITF